MPHRQCKLYPDELALVERPLKPGAIIVADYAPEYLERVRLSAAGYLSVPFNGTVKLSMRLN